MGVAQVPFRILSIGRAPELLQLRSMVLRRAGFSVASVATAVQGLSIVDSEAIDAVLICHTVPTREQYWLVSRLRKSGPLVPVLCVNATDYGRAPQTCIAVSADPDELVAELRLAISSNSTFAKAV